MVLSPQATAGQGSHAAGFGEIGFFPSACFAPWDQWPQTPGAVGRRAGCSAGLAVPGRTDGLAMPFPHFSSRQMCLVPGEMAAPPR